MIGAASGIVSPAMGARVLFTVLTGRDSLIDEICASLPAEVDGRTPYSVWLHFDDAADTDDARRLIAAEVRRLDPRALPSDYLY